MSPASPCLAGTDIVILAGGLGKRLRSALPNQPKILAEIAGRPVLDHQLDWLEAHGADRVLLSLGYLADKVLAHLERRPPGRCRVETIVEPSPLGTGGALAFARPRYRPGSVMVLNGDTLIAADLCAMLRFHDQATRDPERPVVGTLLCRAIEETRGYGRIDIENQRITRFLEKTEKLTGPGFINAGYYLLTPSLLDWMCDHFQEGNDLSIEYDVFQKQPPESLGAFAGKFNFIDIGTPVALEAAQTFFKQRDASRSAPRL